MKIYGDYHTHTIYSHGKGIIRDNVEQAYKLGLKEVAICDHGPGHYLYGVREQQIMEMRVEIDELNKEYEDKGLKILLGVEANIIGFDGTIDINDRILKVIDILLLGYHYGVTPKSFRDGFGLYVKNPLSKFLSLARKKNIERNTDAFIKAINKYPVDLITHPGAKVSLDIKRLAREAALVGTALEINAKHGELSVENIKIAAREGVDFFLSSDAHKPSDVGNIEKSLERAKLSGIDLRRIRNLEV